MHIRLAHVATIGIATTWVAGCTMNSERDRCDHAGQPASTITATSLVVVPPPTTKATTGAGQPSVERADMVEELTCESTFPSPFVMLGDDLFPHTALSQDTVPQRSSVHQPGADRTVGAPTVATPRATAAIVSASPRDRAINNQVLLGIAQNPNLARDAKSIHVTTRTGVVSLTGMLSKDADRQAIIGMVERISGVVRVEDHLQVH
jgi:hypothetical protein